MSATSVVLDRDDMRRTLVRIAHEIVEKNPDGAIALVGIHRRGAVLAKRLHALTSELLEQAVPLGYADISFYRDDFSIRQSDGRQSAPIVHATELDFAVDARTVRPVYRTSSTRSSTTAARRACSWRRWSTAATASSRSAPTTSARTSRPPSSSGSTSASRRSTVTTR